MSELRRRLQRDRDAAERRKRRVRLRLRPRPPPPADRRRERTRRRPSAPSVTVAFESFSADATASTPRRGVSCGGGRTTERQARSNQRRLGTASSGISRRIRVKQDSDRGHRAGRILTGIRIAGTLKGCRTRRTPTDQPGPPTCDYRRPAARDEPRRARGHGRRHGDADGHRDARRARALQLGVLGLSADVDGDGPDLGPAVGPLRPPPDLPDRHRVFLVGSVLAGAATSMVAAHRRPRRSGPRRRRDHPAEHDDRRRALHAVRARPRRRRSSAACGAWPRLPVRSSAATSPTRWRGAGCST